MNYERAKDSIDASLETMGLDHIDLMLLHQAYGDYHGAWRALEEAYHDGKLRAIGVSNFYPVRTHGYVCLRGNPARWSIRWRPMCSANLDVFDFTLDDADRSAIAAMDGGHPIIWDHGSVKVGHGPVRSDRQRPVAGAPSCTDSLRCPAECAVSDSDICESETEFFGRQGCDNNVRIRGFGQM